MLLSATYTGHVLKFILKGPLINILLDQEKTGIPMKTCVADQPACIIKVLEGTSASRRPPFLNEFAQAHFKIITFLLMKMITYILHSITLKTYSTRIRQIAIQRNYKTQTYNCASSSLWTSSKAASLKSSSVSSLCPTPRNTAQTANSKTRIVQHFIAMASSIHSG